MNVLDVLAAVEPRKLNRETVTAMLLMRKRTYTGFASLESEKGFLRPEANLATSRGQEMLRLLLMRFFEELTEAHESEDQVHVREELIDALNYLWTLAVLDPLCPVDWERVLVQELTGPEHIWGHEYPPAEYEIGKLMLYATHLLSTLRNRPWQNAPQSLYFDGWEPLRDFVLVATRYTLEYFDSWEDAFTYFVAKNEVLEFRIRTKY